MYAATPSPVHGHALERGTGMRQTHLECSPGHPLPEGRLAGLSVRSGR